jgi:long-chain acyl-CoA synthetase
VLERLADLSSALPVVSFCRHELAADHAIGWSSFLAAGGTEDVTKHAPVGPGDLATIRYTSGTTGPPKGVAFTHAQLRWMAETMASLIPWRARTRAARYLSFLPMNHVVEGILGTYSAYDLPAPVEITFLEDFRLVASTLPDVRPTVFFSVPRLFQHVWEGLEGSAIGERYMGMRDGIVRRALRPVVRRAMLRRAGLDRCAQLLAGSAPVDDRLLESFRELGVEVHDAYGLTEAPLVALNHLGRNRIGTVGEPLPQTEIRIAGDGEVQVRGPQVTAGYVDEDEQPVHDGWLSTGDLGHLSPDGWLTIDGRKKDLLKTAYGKYLQPSKIEAMLRRIPGVSEAMIVGEGRPFCAALVFVDAADEARTIDAAVSRINGELSHPEQVKRWVVLPNDLSIQTGELTANLKLRRRRVQERFRAEIDALYEEHPAAGIRSAEREEVPV